MTTQPRPFGHYFILEKIAQGGMAEIFKGLTYDFSGLKKFIVIKRILPHIAANQDFIRMLIDEAKIAVRLNHGNVAQTYDLGKVAEDYFIVMEYVPGRTISQIYKKSVSLREGIPLPMAAYMVSEICNGLDYIHRRTDESGRSLGIVHCDISPQNVIVSDSGTVKIVDFGVAKAAFKLSEKDRGVLKGKFAYMSPEQTDGIHVDATSDIFSTGVVLWEALTGRRLFKKKTNSETIEAVQAMTVYPPSAYRNEVPSELDDIVMKALEREPGKRYQSAADISLDLTKFNLKLFPEFKPVQIGEFMGKLFVDEETTGDIYQEKTQLEEETVLEEGGSPRGGREDSQTPVEDTLIIDPQELDFHSLFEEIEMDDVSEVTQAIGFEEESKVQPILKSKPEQEEPTGDMPEDEILGGAGEGGMGIHPSHRLRSSQEGPSTSSLKRNAFWAGGIIAIVVLIYILFNALFSNAPAHLIVKFEPRDALVYLNGEPLKGSSPIRVQNLKPRSQYEIRVTREGYKPFEDRVYLLPSRTKKLNLQLEKGKAGLLEISSEPPGAAIYIDGQATGKTTPTHLEAEKLSFPLVLGLSKEGPPAWSQELSAPPIKNLQIHADLTVSYANLDIRSSPSGVGVQIDKKKLGKTPLYSVQVPAGKDFKLTLELKGYKTQEQKLLLKAGESEEIYQVMQKISSR